MALTQLEVPAASASEHPRTSDATTPSSLAAEQIRLDLRTPMAQLHQAIAEQEQRAINGTLERRGILPHTSIAGADHPSPAAQTVKPSDMADDAKRLHTGLGQLHDWTGRSNHNIEKDLRDTLATMNSTQIAALRSEYKTLYGSDVKDALMADKELSTESKQTLAIYLKGADQRKPNDSLALAEIGTRARNLDMFEEAFRDAAPEARTQYLASGGEAKVKEAFGGIFSDRDVRHAMDYVKGGRLSVETQVEDNTGVFSSNRQAIEHTLSKMTADQKAQYERGEALDKTVPEYIRNGRYSRPNTEGFTNLQPISKPT